ncbi:hypothetical protein GcC1_032035 [Golovinomyces cichoracearum]|uniref:Retrovirus-related Pol polyprotein from transposon TNT 1-94-like beta-barrel domain-containing protein n=1 Tax=Golovinomyces cichoracearum TaxID=62708 RepID=A0A420J246_9PEZI|nr:hypothetical protein GcC1_032035 [Golovinomyces cichoracearum]
MTSQKELLTQCTPVKGVVTLADGKEIPVLGSGHLKLLTRTSSGKASPTLIREVLWVPDLKSENLISESQLEMDGASIMTKQGQRKVYFEYKEFLYATMNSSKQFIIEEQKFNSSFASY